MLAWMLPWLLLMRNTVDFRENGAAECYLNCLNHTITEYADSIECNNALRLVNKMGCMDEDGIWYLGLYFETERPYTVDTARPLMLALIDSFLLTINTTKRLQPYLRVCPFISENIEIRLNMVDLCKYPYPIPGNIKYATFKDGMLSYSFDNPRCPGTLEWAKRESLCLARHLAIGYWATTCCKPIDTPPEFFPPPVTCR
jgi:hypothetical protein